MFLAPPSSKIAAGLCLTLWVVILERQSLGPKDKLPTPLQLLWWSLLVDEGREGGGWIELGFVIVRPVS